MAYKILVTLDLPNVTDEKREEFYSLIKKKGWKKISTVTTAWEKTSYETNRSNAISTIKNDLTEAKNKSHISVVKYALQLDTKDIIINDL